MKIAIYIGKKGLEEDLGFKTLVDELVEGGCELVYLSDGELLPDDVDMLLSIGGDGTFLSASKYVAAKDVPGMGVNLGRMGFLSENRPSDVAQAILAGEYTVESRAMLKAVILGSETDERSEIASWPYALNEFIALQ